MTLPKINVRTLLLSILFLTISVGLGILLYIIFFRSVSQDIEPLNINEGEFIGTFPEAGSNVNKTPTDITNINAALPEAKPSKIAKGGLTEVTTLNKNNIKGLKLTSDGQGLVYYEKDSGLFYRLTTNGQAVLLTDQIFHNVDNITWSPSNQEVILEYPDGSNIYYDFEKNSQVTLPKHWKEFDFSPSGTQIASKSLGQNLENRWLIVSNPDGSRAQKIENLGENEDIVDVNWSPNNQIVATYHKGAGKNQEELFFLGLNNENFKSTLMEGNGFEGIWSPEGNLMLYSVYSANSDYKPTLWLVETEGNNIGNNRRNLGLETWTNKCTFSDRYTLYCGVPISLAEGSGIIPEVADTTPDNIYKINLKTGTKTLLAEPYGSFTVESMVVSRDQKYLYFTDKITGALLKIQIK